MQRNTSKGLKSITPGTTRTSRSLYKAGKELQLFLTIYLFLYFSLKCSCDKKNRLTLSH